MLIKEWMSRSVVTIDDGASLHTASKLFGSMVISMLPVMKNGQLVGVITDGGIKKATPSDATTLDRFEIPSLMSSVKISKIMSQPVITILSDHTVDEAAQLMLKKGISGLPVVGPKGILKGIITKSDIFRCLVSFTGVCKTGQVFAFRLKDRPGIIHRITETIREKGGRLCSVLTSYDDIEEGFRTVFFHSFDLGPEHFDSLVADYRDMGGLRYAADLPRNIRKIF